MKSQKHILIVDDNKDVLYAVKSGLEYADEHYHVECCLGAVECLDYIKDNNVPDLILLDIMMPYKDGWELFAELKQFPQLKEVPIVFLTAKNDEFSKGFGATAAHDYITKPFEILELKEKIEKIMNR
jgi:CheY-like chemotaxis protein